jgi:hypothetical protein
MKHAGPARAAQHDTNTGIHAAMNLRRMGSGRARFGPHARVAAASVRARCTEAQGKVSPGPASVASGLVARARSSVCAKPRTVARGQGLEHAHGIRPSIADADEERRRAGRAQFHGCWLVRRMAASDRLASIHAENVVMSSPASRAVFVNSSGVCDPGDEKSRVWSSQNLCCSRAQCAASCARIDCGCNSSRASPEMHKRRVRY